MFKTLVMLGSLLPFTLATFSQSSTYKLQNYSVNSGGTNSASSSTYKLNASTGEVTGSQASGSTNTVKPSAIEAQQANVPLAPTLSDGSGTYYNQLGVTINQGGADASDYTYAIAVSTDNFVTTKYVQSDGTLNTSQVYQSYATWGGSSGSLIVGLISSTTYKVKVAAKQGLYTNSALGPSATKATVGPQLSFTLTPNTINLGSLLAGTVVSSGTNLSFTFATNAASGGKVYIAGSANGGLKSTAVNSTISSVSGKVDLSGQSSGFGVQGLTASQSSGGPLSIVNPFDGTTTFVGGPTTTFQTIYTSSAALSGGTATASIKAKAAATTPAAADYQEILTFVASASF